MEGAILDHLGDSMLLSGGLDTSVIAAVASRVRKLNCYTVYFPFGNSPDISYARLVSRKFGLPWGMVRLRGGKELEDSLGDVVRTLKTFDPMEVRNSVAVYRGLRAASSEGFSMTMTGDAMDELFAGYSFVYRLPARQMRRALRRLWLVMHFSSIQLAESLGVTAQLPYLDSEVVSLAERLKPSQLVGVRNGNKFGKIIVRAAFEQLIGKKLAWRRKTPIEYGSGTTSLPKYYSEKIGDEEFATECKAIYAKDGVKIRDKEHLHYYRLFRRTYPPPKESRSGVYACPACGGSASRHSNFCVICGAYPIKARHLD